MGLFKTGGGPDLILQLQFANLYLRPVLFILSTIHILGWRIPDCGKLSYALQFV